MIFRNQRNRDDLERYIKSNVKVALQAKREIYRQWYSTIRQLDKEFQDILYRQSIGTEDMDDMERFYIIPIEIAILRLLLAQFGQNPNDDPEMKGE